MEDYLNDIVNDISRMVRFDSHEREPLEGMPFGEGAAKALECYLSMAESFGFETKNYDNYVGEVTFGSGEEFAILAHLDVVPAGSGWTHDPFGGEIDEEKGRIWGRGTTDDKGPAVITLHALKSLKDEGFVPGRKIKLIVGCNEETGWRCLEHYNEVAHMPDEGFSPDADFPVLYAEKGILHVRLRFAGRGMGFSGLRGGNRANMVCDRCSVECDAPDGKVREYGLERDGGTITSVGKSAHGSTPDEGVNAIAPMLGFLGLDDVRTLLFDEKLGMKDFSDETGHLTLSPDIIEQDGEDVYVTCDIRYPSTYRKETILSAIDACGVSYEITNFQAPLYNDRGCRLITTLCDVYNEVTGRHAEPMAIGGGTYARALKCGAGFGPEEEGDESVMHAADEYITFEKIEKCFRIYRKAIERLCG